MCNSKKCENVGMVILAIPELVISAVLGLLSVLVTRQSES